MGKYKKYSLSSLPAPSSRSKDRMEAKRLIFQIRIEYIKRKRKGAKRQKSARILGIDESHIDGKGKGKKKHSKHNKTEKKEVDGGNISININNIQNNIHHHGHTVNNISNSDLSNTLVFRRNRNRCNSVSTTLNVHSVGGTPSDAYSVVSVDSNDTYSVDGRHGKPHRDRKDKNGQRRKKYRYCLYILSLCE